MHRKFKKRKKIENVGKLLYILEFKIYKSNVKLKFIYNAIRDGGRHYAIVIKDDLNPIKTIF